MIDLVSSSNPKRIFHYILPYIFSGMFGILFRMFVFHGAFFDF